MSTQTSNTLSQLRSNNASALTIEVSELDQQIHIMNANTARIQRYNILGRMSFVMILWIVFVFAGIMIADITEFHLLTTPSFESKESTGWNMKQIIGLNILIRSLRKVWLILFGSIKSRNKNEFEPNEDCKGFTLRI